MRPAFLALLASLLGLGVFKVGVPQIQAFPSTDGTMVLKLSLSRAPGFVAYLRTGGKRQLGAGEPT